MSATCVSRALTRQRARLDIDADGLARREQLVGVAGAAAEVEHPAWAEQGRAQAYSARWRWKLGLNPPCAVVTRSPVITGTRER